MAHRQTDTQRGGEGDGPGFRVQLWSSFISRFGFFLGVEVFVLVYACVVADLLCLFCCLFVFLKKVENAFPSVSYDKFF